MIYMSGLIVELKLTGVLSELSIRKLDSQIYDTVAYNPFVI